MRREGVNLGGGVRPARIAETQKRALVGSGTSALLPCHMAVLSHMNLVQNDGVGGAVDAGATGPRPRAWPCEGKVRVGRWEGCAGRTVGVDVLLDVPEHVSVGRVAEPARHLVLLEAPLGQDDWVRPGWTKHTL